VWAFLLGIGELVAAVRLRKVVTGEWMLALAGVLAIALGVLLLVRPAAGLLTMIWFIGAYAILFGVLFIALGLKLRRVGQSGGARPVSGAPLGPRVFQGTGGA